MGKKRRIKKNNGEKRGHDPNDNPRNTSRDWDWDWDLDLDLVLDDFISSLHNDILHQQKEDDPDNVTRNIANNMDPNDFISRLPNDILYHIISLLPFESAVRTTFLSTCWKDLWKEALLALVHDVAMEDAITTVSRFLDDFTIHHTPRKYWDIGYDDDDDDDDDDDHRPRKNWGFKFDFGHGRVLLVAIAPKRTHQLVLSAGKQEYARPFDWLLKLNLSSRRRHWPFYTGWIQHTQKPSFCKVKSLYLVSVSYPSNEAASSLVSNFPFLESLTIAKCNGLRSLQIKGARELDKLVVLDCKQLESLSFEGSYLTSFQYRGRLVSFKFEVSRNDYRSIWSPDPQKFHFEDAMLDFRQGPLIYNRINCDGFKSILESIKGVASLTLCRWVFEPFISYMLPSLGRASEFRLHWLRELWWIDCSAERDNVNALLSFLKHCPYLQRLYVTIDPGSYSMSSAEKYSSEVNELEKLDDLKLLKLEGFANENKEIFFTKWLRPLFRRGPLILAKSKEACLRRLVKAPELEKRGKYPYKFKVVKNCHETYPDHVHMKV